MAMLDRYMSYMCQLIQMSTNSFIFNVKNAGQTACFVPMIVYGFCKPSWKTLVALARRLVFILGIVG